MATVPHRDRLRGWPAFARTSFIGRASETEEIVRWLGDALLRSPGSQRWITLTGPGGVGKTRLALRVAEVASELFPEGGWFIPLGSVQNQTAVASTIGKILDIGESGGRSVFDGLAAKLHDARVLLLLDNLEQVVSSVPEIAGLLDRCPNLVILATSRTSVRISGERQYEVRPLELPSIGRGIRGCGQSEAVRLFEERARDANQDFAVTPANIAVIGDICRQLDGLPLAIELAAARVKHLAPVHLLRELAEHRLSLLTDGSREMLPHQQTMRGTIAWSCNLLTLDEQVLLRRLGVFVGGFTEVSARHVVPDDPAAATNVLCGILALADAGLVMSQEAESDGPRFRMMGTVRDFALEQLAANDAERAAVEHRLAQFLANLIDSADVANAMETRGDELDGWLRRADSEIDNLRAALRWAIKRPDAVLAVKLATSLGQYWDLRDRFTEGLDWIMQALDVAERTPDTAIPAGLLYFGGTLAQQLGDGPRAVALGQRLRHRSEKAGDALGAATAFGVISLGHSAHQHHKEADEAARAGLRRLDGITATSDDERRLNILRARMLNRIATELHVQAIKSGSSSQLVEAREKYEQSLVIRRQCNLISGVVATCSNLGMLYTEIGEIEDALQHHKEAIEQTLDIGQQWHLWLNFIGMAYLAAKGHQDWRAAARFVGAADRLINEHDYGLWFLWNYGRERTIELCEEDVTSRANFAAERADGYALDWRRVANEAIAYIPPARAETGSAARQTFQHLITQREMDILKLLAQGKRRRAIAAELFISARTVEAHADNLRDRTESETIAEAVRKWGEGLVGVVDRRPSAAASRQR